MLGKRLKRILTLIPAGMMTWAGRYSETIRETVVELRSKVKAEIATCSSLNHGDVTSGLWMQRVNGM